MWTYKLLSLLCFFLLSVNGHAERHYKNTKKQIKKSSFIKKKKRKAVRYTVIYKTPKKKIKKRYFYSKKSKNRFIKRLLKSKVKKRHIIVRKKRYYKKINIKTKNKKNIFDSVELSQSKIGLRYSNGESQFQSNKSEVLTGFEIQQKRFLGKFNLYYSAYNEKTELNETNEETFEPHDFYLQYDNSFLSITLGNQLFSWGVFDEGSAFDTVNKKKQDEFLINIGEEVRFPKAGIRIQHYGKINIDFFVSDERRDDYLAMESIWSGIDKTNGKIRGINLNTTQSNLIQNLEFHEEKKDSIGHGLKISGNFDFGDISLYHLRHTSNFPAIKLSDTLRAEILNNAITPTGLSAGMIRYFPIENKYGIDFSAPIGLSVFKLEYAQIDNFEYFDQALQIETGTKHIYTIGSEVFFENFDLRIDWQYSKEILPTKDLNQNESYDLFIYQISNTYFNENLKLGLRNINNQTDKSHMIKYFSEYNFTDNFLGLIEYVAFSGLSKSFFGYHKENHFGRLGLKYTF